MKISVVIASYNAELVIEGCLQRLRNQQGSVDHEIIVADCSTDRTPNLIKSEFPHVSLLHFDSTMCLAELRARAIRQSRGDIIAILDPYSMAGDDWLVSLVALHEKHLHPVIGGSVDLHDKHRKNLLQWAQYFNEYGMFMSPVSTVAAEILPGSNISYKRHLLHTIIDGNEPAFWKTFINDALIGRSDGMLLSPAIRVSLDKPIPFLHFFKTRYLHGRCYAAMRCSKSSSVERFLRAASSPLIPFVLQWRWGRTFWPKGHHRLRFVLTLPVQLILFCAWALGECAGYLIGDGDSCSRLTY